jgi:octaprenyl-diphosphate synthase
MVQLGDMSILRQMADTTNTIAEGEVLQLTRAGDANTTEDQYLDVIRRKTAILFAAGCWGAAQLCGKDASTLRAMHEFGLNLGIAFQMIDDVLDYDGDPSTMGKNVGDDLTEGKPTLPLIHVLREGTAPEQALVREAIAEKNAECIADVFAAVQRCGSLDYTRDRARHYHDLALQRLTCLPDGAARNALQTITDLSINRDH